MIGCWVLGVTMVEKNDEITADDVRSRPGFIRKLKPYFPTNAMNSIDSRSLQLIKCWLEHGIFQHEALLELIRLEAPSSIMVV